MKLSCRFLAVRVPAIRITTPSPATLRRGNGRLGWIGASFHPNLWPLPRKAAGDQAEMRRARVFRHADFMAHPMLKPGVPKSLLVALAILALFGAGCGSLSGNKSAQRAGHEDAALLAAQTADMLSASETASAAVAPNPIGKDTPIRQGDRLRVDVWMRDRVTQLKGYPLEAEATATGVLFFPHAGMIEVVRLTPGELQDRLRRHFADLLQDATVIVERTRLGAIGSGQRVGTVSGAVSLEDIPLHFIVLGDVAHPGVYSLGPNLRLREAIALAGGPDRRRARRHVFLVRGTQENPETLRVNLNDILYGRDMSGNVELRNNDAIYVPTKRLWRMADFVNTLLTPIMGVRDTVWLYDRLR